MQKIHLVTLFTVTNTDWYKNNQLSMEYEYNRKLFDRMSMKRFTLSAVKNGKK